KIRFLLLAQLGWPGKQIGYFLCRQRTRIPLLCLQTKLLVLGKLAAYLDEVAVVKRPACFVIGMIAPDPQRQPIARVSEIDLAVRLCFARHFSRSALDLCMEPRGDESILCPSADLTDGEQLDHSFATPITPQASRPPASPVGCVLRSSAFSCTMTACPRIESLPLNFITLSVKSKCAFPL